jgi:hypothetical protein
MSKAYVVDIKKSSLDSHHMDPAYMLTFVRWTNRDTLRMQSKSSLGDLGVTKPMIVINDCISVTTNMGKSMQTPSVNMVLKAGDINYEAAIAPGDFVFVNMLDDGKKLNELYSKASSGKAINHQDDGFKGFYKVQSVRRVIGVDPASGIKRVFFRIDGYAFTEFNNSIYFNPYLVSAPKFQTDIVYASNIGLDYKQMMDSQKEKTGASVEFVIRFFIEKFLGYGLDVNSKFEQQITSNTLFYVPSLVGSLVNQPTAEAAKDVYNYLFGIQTYDSFGGMSSGMNPNSKSVGGRFYSTGVGCQGNILLRPEYWNQVPVWSILKQYVNSPMNEMYSCFRISKDGTVMPTVVLRQIPFSTEAYGGTGTKFLNLPRWKIDPELIYDFDIGRDEAARINFVQVFGMQGGEKKPDAGISFQIEQGNYVADTNDIKRAGLRPYVITSSFDFPSVKENAFSFHAPTWAKMLADALIGGHLKMNGTVTCTGIQAPIACGDNFEVDNIVYHIESVTHSMSMGSDGRKRFRTTLQLSNGIDKNYTAKQPRYADMEFTDVELERQKQFANDQLFNGFSDEQILPSRPGGVKLKSNNNSFLLPRRKTSADQSLYKVDKKSKRLIK